jgi:hypothetical protein
MKKVMIMAAAVLFSAGLFAQTPQKPAEKKEPVKTEQKASAKQTASTASKPEEHKTTGSHPAHHTHSQSAANKEQAKMHK